MFIFDLVNGAGPLNEGSDIERKIHRTQALIQDYYNRSRNTSSDIKRDHYIDMARQLEYELEGMINDANQAEQDSYSVAQHDAEPSATWNRGGLNEFAIDKNDNGDGRSKLVGSIAQLLKAGKKVDFFVPGIRGHVSGIGGQGEWVTLKRWNKPYSKINYSLALDSSDDNRFALKMIKPDYYQVVEKQDLNQGVAEGSKIAKYNKHAKAPKPKNQQEYDAIEKYKADLAKSYQPKKQQGVAEGSGDAAFAEGYSAFHAGTTKNPYQPGSEASSQWDLGWETAQSRTWDKEGVSEAQSMGGALTNALSRVEPGSKLDKKIKHHNDMVRRFGKGTMTSAPDGYHIDKKGLVRLGQGVAETKVSKYADLGATKDTTHFIKNVTTGEIVSPHRGKQDAEDALVALYRGPRDGNEYKIVRARKDRQLDEFAPGGNSASSYYAVTDNFVNEFAQQKEEELQDLIAAGWTKKDLAQAGTLEGQAEDIAHFEQIRDGFLKGLKPGFDAYLRGDTQMKDQLGEYWLDNDLPLNQDWESIYGEPWGDDGLDEALNEFSFGNDDDDGRVPDPYGQPKPQHYNRSIDFFGQFEADWFDKEDMNDATGEFKGYWNNSNGKPTQIAYFKFDNPRRTGSNHPGMGWYYEPELDESQLNEFAPSSDDNRENSPEDVLFRFAKMWYSAPDVATQRKVEQALAKVGWEIGELESEEGGAYVMQIGDDAGDSYIGWSEEDLAGLDEQGVAEGSLNEVNPMNYDSDVDYYNAVRSQGKQRGPQEPEDAIEPAPRYTDKDAESDISLARQKKAATGRPAVNYNKDVEGSAPNGQRYNAVMTINAPDTMSADHEVRSFNDHNWGAKKIVDTVKDGSNYTVYIVDNHKYGMWTPFKDQPAELDEGRKGFDTQLVQILRKDGYKGPVRLGQLKAWDQELSDILDSDDMVMIAGNDPTFDSYVAFETLTGRYISGGEGGYYIPTLKQLIKTHTMREGKTLDKIADREHSLKRDRFRSLSKDNLREGEVDYSIGDDVIITGPVQYKGATGMVDSFGQDKRFVVVDLYNYGKRSFHTSDVSFNDYADSDEEEADMYDKDEDFRDWSNSGYDFK